MELLLIKAPADIARLSEQACILFFQDFAIGDHVAILPCCKKPLDTTELWKHIAFCVHARKPVVCPHCRDRFDTRPIDKLYPRDTWPYRLPAHLNRTFTTLKEGQELLLKGLHERSATMKEAYTRTLGGKDARKLPARLARLIQRHTYADVDEILDKGKENTMGWPISAARLTLLDSHWRRQVPTLGPGLSMADFRQTPKLNDLIWPLRRIEIADAFCIRAEFHVICHNETYMRGARRHFYFLVGPQQTVADLGAAFLRTYVGDSIDAEFRLEEWVAKCATPFFLVEDDGLFQPLSWNEKVTTQSLGHRKDILIQEFEKGPGCMCPFWAGILEPLMRVVEWRQAGIDMRQEHEEEEERKNALKLETIWKLSKWNAADEQLATRLARDLESNISEQSTAISRLGIQQAQQRIEGRRAAIHEIMNIDVDVERLPNGDIVMNTLVPRWTEEDNRAAARIDWSGSIAAEEWERFFAEAERRDEIPGSQADGLLGGGNGLSGWPDFGD